MKEDKIKVLLVEPEQAPREFEIENTLKAQQQLVGGWIQAVYPWEDPVALVCNEEGKNLKMPFNRSIGHDFIVGTFFICGLGEEDFSSLSPELMQKYKQKFRNPEVLIQMGNRIMVVPVPETKPPKPQKPKTPER
ncbi:DUF3846 domain-containing protein [Anaerotruncus rubiinfantis]|uniref:DUF3846 domain-containing protein n=1 Tax=Anaerotruncus rubiinfantis TaxID=1720200 RepID=UPI0034A49D63